MINFCYENMHPSGQIALITDVIHPDLIPLIRLGFEEVFVLHVNSGEQGCIGGPFYDVFKRMADYTTDSESLEVYTSRLEHVFSKYLLPRWFGKMSICQVLSKINKKPNDLLMLADDTVPSLSYMIAASIRLTHGEVDLIVPISATSVALATNIARILRTVTVPVLSPRDYPALDTFRRNRVVMIDDVLTVSQRRRASNVASYLTSETYKILGLYAVKRPMGTENLIPLPFPVKTMIFDMSSKYLYTYDIMTTARFEL